MDWGELLPELRNLIRGELGAVARNLLRWTCKSEHAIVVPRSTRIPLDALFKRACADGSLDVCKWIFDYIKDMRYNNSQFTRTSLPHTTSHLLHYDAALHHRQFHVAQWAFDTGLRLTNACANQLAVAGVDDAVRWMATRGLPITVYSLRDVATQALREWLVMTRGMLISASDIIEAVDELHLGSSTEELAFYIRMGYDVPMRAFGNVLSMGRWTTLDYLKQCASYHYYNATKTYPGLRAAHDARPVLGAGEYIDFVTGQVVEH